jgi:hypothetical protein
LVEMAQLAVAAATKQALTVELEATLPVDLLTMRVVDQVALAAMLTVAPTAQ